MAQSTRVFAAILRSAKATHTIDCAKQGWANLTIEWEILYLIRDKNTGQALKVGTTSGLNWVSRFTGDHLPRAAAEGREIVADFLVLEKGSSARTAAEKSLRDLVSRQGHSLPWDKQGKRMPSQFPEQPRRPFPGQ